MVRVDEKRRSQESSNFALRSLWRTAAAALALAAANSGGMARMAPAAEATVRLKKSGMELRGAVSPLETLVVNSKKKPDPDAIVHYPIVQIATPLKRYLIPERRQESVNKDIELSRHEGFRLPQKRQARGGVIGSVQGFLEKPEPFDAYGHRMVLLRTASGETPVYQGETEITPEYLKITALNFEWETALATSSIAFETLDAMLRNLTRTDDADARLKIARFYIQAGLYGPAERELESIGTDFPTLAPVVGPVKIMLAQALAQDVLNELRLRRAAGQHRFVYETSQKFPIENVEAPILREVREITAEYDQTRDKAAAALARLGELHAELKSDPREREIAPLRAEISEGLNYSSFDRLDAFVKLAAGAQLAADEQMSLALSGWAAGSTGAVTELDQALRMWQARSLILDYLKTADDAQIERKAILKSLESLEGVGPERIEQMIPLLPAVLETAGAAPGRAVRIEVAGRSQNDQPTAYWVSLPLEYHSAHAYPLIIALRSEQGSPQQELQGFWGGTEERPGQSQRHGYIVIGPEYLTKADAKGYSYSAASHQIVIDSLRDARKRFNIDSNRVFLSGHGVGGEAAWDIGLAHPDLVAGIIPINGAIDRYSKHYLDNARELPLFAVTGELNRELRLQNVFSMMKMFEKGFDLISTEYKGAGPDSFYAEIHVLFNWMSKQRRGPPPKQVNAKTLRSCDNRFFWYECSGIPENIVAVDWANEKQRPPRPLPIVARITPGNTINVTSRAAHHRLWLPRGEGLIDFERRVKVEINGKRVWNEFVKPDVGMMLEHLRIHGDRQQLYWGALEF